MILLQKPCDCVVATRLLQSCIVVIKDAVLSANTRCLTTKQ